MYKIVPNRRAWWPVKWPGVTEEGEIIENRIELRFMIHSEDDHLGLSAKAAALASQDAKLPPAEEKPLSHYFAEFLQEIAVDWRGVHAENGDPLKWDAGNIQLLMKQPGTFSACVEAYSNCRVGAGKGS